MPAVTLLSYFVVPMAWLYAGLLGSAGVLLLVALSLWWRVRHQMHASDDSLRRVLSEMQRERQPQEPEFQDLP
jgi:uncharacterized membrane protein YqjE